MPGALHDLDDRTDVGDDRAGRAVRPDRQSGARDLPHQPLDVLGDARAGAGQADIGALDAKAGDEMQDAEFLIDGRCADRGGLQPITQGFVVEQNRPERRALGRLDEVPVVDEGVRHEPSER